MAADVVLNGDDLNLEARSTPLTEDSASEAMIATVVLDVFGGGDE